MSGKWLGLTVDAFDYSLGLNGQAGELRVYAVQDLLAGDVPLIPLPNSPVYFTFGGLRFGGLLQQWGKELSTAGERYTFTAVDPTAVLEAGTVITGGFVRALPGVNVLNAYGWRENGFGFGAAGVTEAGMPWANVRAALLNFFGGGSASAYGGPINYRGVLYTVDLSQLPVGPAGYRVPAGTLSLAELVSQVCDDCQLDWFVQLDGLVVRVRTVDRSQAANLGSTALALAGASYAGLVPRYSIGAEAARDATGLVLTGGPLSTVFIQDAVASYWGDTLAGVPIVGTPFTHPDLPAEPCEAVTLPCPQIADAVGDVQYATNTVELRCALGGFDAWSAYVEKYKPAFLDRAAGLFGAAPGALAKVDLLKDDRARVLAALDEEAQTRAAVVHNWLRAHAEEFFGKRFLVRLDGVLASVNGDDTFSVRVDSGGWIPGGPGSLGLGVLDQDKFADESGRVVAFATLPDVHLLDPNELDPSATAVAGNALFVRAAVDPVLVQVGGAVYAKVDLGDAVYRRERPDGGDIFGTLNGTTPGASAHQAGGTLGMLAVHPHPQYPSRVGVPATSTTDTYGPWQAVGAPGRVEVVQEPGLVPWEFGGELGMNTAALARVHAAASARNHAEWAEATFAGVPLASPGDVLAAGGPTLTGVSVNYSVGGLTTTYRFAASTPARSGLLARSVNESLRRAAAQGREARAKAVRGLAARQLLADGRRQAKSARAFRKNMPKWVKKESPQEVVVASVVPDGSGGLRAHASVTTVEEGLAVAFATGSDDTWRRTALSSWTAVLRPFEAAGPTGLPTGGVPPLRLVPALTGPNSGGMTAGTLNHLAGPHDVEVLSWGPQYTGANARARGPNPTGVRSVGLRGPVVVEGWGRGLDGLSHPTGSSATEYAPDFRRRPDLAKVGYLDPLWDERRSLWTVHDVYTGKTTAAIGSGGTGAFRVGNDPSWVLPLASPYSSLPSGGDVVAAYAANEGRLIAVGPAAPPAGGRGGYLLDLPCLVMSGSSVVGLAGVVVDPDGSARCVVKGACPTGSGCGAGSVPPPPVSPPPPPPPPPVPPYTPPSPTPTGYDVFVRVWANHPSGGVCGSPVPTGGLTVTVSGATPSSQAVPTGGAWFELLPWATTTTAVLTYGGADPVRWMVGTVGCGGSPGGGFGTTAPVPGETCDDMAVTFAIGMCGPVQPPTGIGEIGVGKTYDSGPGEE